MKKKKYNIEVVFSTPVYVTVEAEDVCEAMDEAEYQASQIFISNLNEGLLGQSDFYCEAQTP